MINKFKVSTHAHINNAYSIDLSTAGWICPGYVTTYKIYKTYFLYFPVGCEGFVGTASIFGGVEQRV